ncbi:PREDICTED: uncharacterized protein LOC109590877 [Amphimedon queenslandica]|nr:PREDICTED: uncharacterized protein LOC109590877 [Amphimedon queenslandica]|eukprot:XP_019862289.1 PREDICTED: uncharacterized protein LOC109590877 [Amphimedon queenslandica]
MVDSIRVETSKGNTRGNDSASITITSGLLPRNRKRPREDSDQELENDVNFSTTNLQGTLEQLMKDKGFVQLTTSAIQKAQDAATKILDWISKTPSRSNLYDAYLKSLFKMWTSVPPANGHIREQVWSRFSYFCSSEEYVQFWKSVHQEAGVTDASPLLSFYTTYNMFTNLWKEAYPVHGVVGISRSTEPLTDDERKAMWYVGGYFIKNLTKKINSKIGSHPKYTHDLLLILESLEETDERVEDDETNDELHIKSKDWFNAINRGGLTRCTNEFYNFMINLEKEIKRMLEELDEFTTEQKIDKNKVITHLKSSKSITSSWEELRSADELMAILLDLLLQEYINFRIFSDTNKIMEQYKLQKKTTLQKKKSLRRNIQN